MAKCPCFLSYGVSTSANHGISVGVLRGKDLVSIGAKGGRVAVEVVGVQRLVNLHHV